MSNFIKYILGIGNDQKKEEKNKKKESNEKKQPINQKQGRKDWLAKFDQGSSSEQKKPLKVIKPKVIVKKEKEKPKKKPNNVKVEKDVKKIEPKKVIVIPAPKKPKKIEKSPQIEIKKPKKTKKPPFHRIVKKVFLCTLTPPERTMFVQLNELSKTTNTINELNYELGLVERIKYIPLNETAYSFLLNCFKRCNKIRESLLRMKEKVEGLKEENEKKQKKVNLDSKLSIVKKIKSLVLKYIGISLIDSSFFPIPHNPPKVTSIQKIVSSLVNMQNDSLNYGILADLIENFKTDAEMLKLLVYPILEELNFQMSKLSYLNNNFLAPVHILLKLFSRKEVLKIIVEHPKFSFGKTGKELEEKSLLGPFLRISVNAKTNALVGSKLFKDVRTLKVSELQQIYNTVRLKMREYHDFLHKFVFAFIKEKETRNAMIELLAKVIELNEAKGKLMDTSRTSSSDGFMINFCAIMLRLSNPFLDIDKKREYVKLKPGFVMLNNLVNFRENTKLGRSISEAKEIYKDRKMDRLLLRDKLYFFTYKALHIGLINNFRNFNLLTDRINRLYNQRKLLATLAPGSNEYRQIDNDYYIMVIQKWTEEVHLFDQYLLDYVIRYYRFSTALLLFLMNPQNVEFKLPKLTPEIYACLPEYFVTDIIDLLYNLMTKSIKLLTSHSQNEFVDLVIYLLGNKQYFSNPNERSKFTDILLSYSPNPRFTDVLSKVLLNSRKACKFVITCLIDLYIEVEEMENSYYIKHKPRFQISLILKYLWKYKQFQKSFEENSKVNKGKKFLQFFNMNINDATYLLDESLNALKEIHDFELKLKNVDEWQALAVRERRELEERNNANRRTVRLDMQLASSTVNMLNFISKDLSKPFLREDLLPRIAEMLNFFLLQLTDEAKNYNVKNKKDLNFDPKVLLTEITDVYMNFKNNKMFVKAVAADDRSFRPQIFEKAIYVLRFKTKNKTSKYIEDFEIFSLSAMETREKLQKEEEDLGEIPEEFQDGMLYSLMDDPVKLPSSQIVVDRKTIERHLLNYSHDPYTRVKLTSDMLIELPDLKKRIEEFKKKKKM